MSNPTPPVTAVPAQPDAQAPAGASREQLLDGLRKLKVRFHFMGWPAESMWNAGTAEEPRWIPDWRYELQLLDHLLHGSPITTPEKPNDTKPAHEVAAPTAQAAPAPTPDQIAAYLQASGAYVTNDATREAAIADAVAADRSAQGAAEPSVDQAYTLVSRQMQNPEVKSITEAIARARTEWNAQGAAERAAPAVEDVDLPDAEDMAHSAVQEALSFGLSHQVVHKWMRHIQDQTVKAMLAAAPAHVQTPAETEHVAADVSKNGLESNMTGGASTPGEWFVRRLEKDGVLKDCFVAAPDCTGCAYDAEILGDDEYRGDVARKLADCELIVAAVTQYRASHAQARAGAAAPEGAARCNECDGTGSSWSFEHAWCPKCDGTGQLPIPTAQAAPAAKPVLVDAERQAAARRDPSLAAYWRNHVVGLVEEFTTDSEARFLADRIVGALYDLPLAGVERPAPAAGAVAGQAMEYVPWPKKEDITEDMRAGFERLFQTNRDELNKTPDGKYRALRTEADWVFYQRVWADAMLAAAPTPAAQADSGVQEDAAPNHWIVMAPCGQGVVFNNKADAKWTLTGRGAGADGFGVPTIGDAFRESYDEGLVMVPLRLDRAALAAKGGAA